MITSSKVLAVFLSLAGSRVSLEDGLRVRMEAVVLVVREK
jgi:hypothetical protein